MAKGIIRKRREQDTGDSPEGVSGPDYSDQASMKSEEELFGKPEQGIEESGFAPSQRDMASTAREYDPMFGEIPNMEYESPAGFTVGSLRKLRMPGVSPNMVRTNSFKGAAQATDKEFGMLARGNASHTAANEALLEDSIYRQFKSNPENLTKKTVSKEAIADMQLKKKPTEAASDFVTDARRNWRQKDTRGMNVGSQWAAAKDIQYAPHEDIHRQMDSLPKAARDKLEGILENRLSPSSNEALDNILRAHKYKDSELAGEKMSWLQDMFGEYGSLKDKEELKRMSGLGPEEWEEFKRDARKAYNTTVKDINGKPSRKELEAWIQAEHESGFVPYGDAAESGIAAAKRKK